MGVPSALGPLRTGFALAVDAGLLTQMPDGLDRAHQTFEADGIVPPEGQVKAWLRQLEAVVPQPSWRRAASRGGRVVLGLAVLALVSWGARLWMTLPAADDGLTATYFAKPHFMGHPFSRIDPDVSLEWDVQGPLPGVPGTGFSAIWKGCLVVEAQNRWLVARSDSPFTVDVAGELLAGGGPEAKALQTADDALPRGVHPIEITLDHVGQDGRLFIGLRQGHRGVGRAFGALDLVPVGGNARHDCPGEPPDMLR